MTNLRRTCSVYAVCKTVCGIITREEYDELINTNADFKNKLQNKVNTYRDSYFKFLTTMVRNVFAFRQVNSAVLRMVVYKLRETAALKGAVILHRGECSPLTYFIKEGKVHVYVRDEDFVDSDDEEEDLDNDPDHLAEVRENRARRKLNPELLNAEEFKKLQEKKGKKRWYHYATLDKGSCFNLVSSFLNRPSIFYFVVAGNEAHFLVLDQDDFRKLCLRSESLNNVIQSIKATYGKEHIKYDYGRMVFQNVSELIQAQKLKAEFEKQQEQQASPQPNLTDLDSPMSPFGKHASFRKDPTSYLRIKKKFWRQTKKAKKIGFHIGQMHVFELIDSAYNDVLAREKKKNEYEMKKLYKDIANYVGVKDIPAQAN